MIDNSLNYCIDKILEKKRKQEAKKQVITDKAIDILRKYDTSLPKIQKSELTKGEYNAILKGGYPLRLYPNLQ